MVNLLAFIDHLGLTRLQKKGHLAVPLNRKLVFPEE
jgi:hypothetical protein